MRIALAIFAFAVITAVDGQKKKADCPTIKTKQQWGGKAATSVDYQTIPVQSVIMHHTVTGKCDSFESCANIVKNIQDFHMKIKYSDIAYNFLIGNDGVVYEGRGWHKIGAHARGFNSNSTGIAFIGDFTNELPTRKALNSAKKLLKCGIALGELGPRFKLLAALQVKDTVSPGLPVYGEMQKWDNWVPSV